MEVIAPSRLEQFVDKDGFVRNERINRFHEMVADKVNTASGTTVSITSTDSPFSALDGQRILADMSTGDIIVVLPSTGSVSVSRQGSPNTLTIQGVVNGVTNPTILYDGSTASMAYFASEWRYE